MKNIAGYTLLIVALVFLAGCIGSPSSQQTVVEIAENSSQVKVETAAPVSYTNKLYALEKPANWEVEENQAFTYFKTSAEEDSNNFQENVVVHILPITSGQTLIGFFQDSITELMTTGTNFTVVEHSEASFGDIPAYKIIYLEGEQSMQKKYLQVFAVKGNNGYVVTYTAPPETFDNYLPEAESIIDSYDVK